MKARSVISTLLIALTGAIAGLFIYTRFLDRQDDSAMTQKTNENATYTALPGQEPIDFTFAAENTVHAVVHVKIKTTVNYGINNPLYEFFYGQGAGTKREVQGYGSGVIISRDGYIVTNNHVIDEADDIEVVLNDRRTFDAEVVGRDPSTDIALIKIKAEDLPCVKFGDSDAIKLGQWVLAVGNPFNLTSTVTAGIISAKGRNLNLLNADYRIESFIQTDAALNQGNSGGALVNVNGELIGITSAIYSPNGAYAGNSFAVPSSIVKKVVEDLKQYGEVQRGLMGVEIEDVTSDIAKEMKMSEIKGVLLRNVNGDGAAAAAGLEKGDVILFVNDQAVSTTSELQEKINRYRPGDKVKIGYLRKGKNGDAEVTLRNAAGNTEIVAPGSYSATVFGASVSQVSARVLEQYNIDNGVMITSVGEGRFKSLGLGRGTIIISINGQKVSSATDIKKASDNEKTLTSVEGFTPDGTYFKLQTRR